ncbi:MAG TPA: class I SAM-dependent methyltransferase [Cyclobacteriaceae bacterium]|nr:class I SAM-dependent methyltransferase [Cyclobacteriaceae bacterium]
MIKIQNHNVKEHCNCAGPGKITATVVSLMLFLSLTAAEAQEFTADYSPISGLIRFMESPEREAWQKPDDVISLFGDIEGLTIMDLGSGSGYFTLRMAQKAGKVIAGDVDERYLSYINEKLNKRENSNLRGKIELRKIPYDNPGLKEGEADGILVVNTFHHMENRIVYFKNALKGLKPGGIIIIVDYIKGISFGPSDEHKIEMAEALGELKQVGFSEITTNSQMLKYQFIILCQK